MANVLSIIGGKQLADNKHVYKDIYNPATGELSSFVQMATATDLDHAVQVSKAAFTDWAATPPAKRTQIMFNFRHLLHNHIDELAHIITSEHGKTIADAKGEIIRGIEIVDYCCNIQGHLQYNYSHGIANNMDSYEFRSPIGVVAGITPFNFPAMVPMWMFPIAISCGNTFILKPSEKDPSASLFLENLLRKSGLPNGVFNILQGDHEVVNAILKHPDISAVSFVGSTPVAKHIYEEAQKNGKQVQALGGAKNHLLCMPDANINTVSSALIGAAYGSAGERCMAISVGVVVGDETADKLISSLQTKIKNLTVGPGCSPKSDLGPLISAEHKQKVLNYIKTGIAEGAKLIVDNSNVSIPGHKDGYYVGCCLFDHVTQQMQIYQDEIFGPVLCILRAQDYEEAIKIINSHKFGNGASIFTTKGAYARDFASRVSAGMIGINVPIPVPTAFHSFGGHKSSIFGDSNLYGQEGIKFYTKPKTITTRWKLEADEKIQLNFPQL